MKIVAFRKDLPKPVLRTEGFTLLEVMIALAIMLVAFSSILAIQSSSMNSALKSRQIHEVSVLARNAMLQTEIEISGKKFEELPPELSVACEEGNPDYTCTRKIKEVKLPNLAGLSKAAQGENGGGSSKDDDEKNSAILEQMTKVITNFLSKAVREVTITVSWKRGTTTQKYDVAMYWVDLNSDFNINP
ncbi:MAG: prepilin-type N-terminal cleavage/methylation domain-containing protein [Bdellovibrionales bacterium]|nr:prepilin-type N-terminal cleavage/methylation domain-containing protein [Bdellovibrionales bacterium]